MWHTELGDRALEGYEAKLMRAAIHAMFTSIDDERAGENQERFDIEAFDKLSIGQRLFMLAEVGEALLSPTIPTPELTAANEATIAALFVLITDCVIGEIEGDEEDGERSSWRELVSLTCKETKAESIKPTSKKVDDWEHAVHMLEIRVLWEDSDYNIVEDLADSPPDVAGATRERMGISDEYAAYVPPDPRDDELPKLRERIAKLVSAT